MIRKHLSQGFKFMYMSLVQVATTPLARQGHNAYGCHNQFHNLVFGIVESSLHQGPIYFNCYPYFLLSLSDATTLHSWILNMKLFSYDIMEGTESLAIVYRLHYKLMNTTLDPRSKIKLARNTTLLIQTSNESPIFLYLGRFHGITLLFVNNGNYHL